jgi:hypothetical protein
LSNGRTLVFTSVFVIGLLQPVMTIVGSIGRDPLARQTVPQGLAAFKSVDHSPFRLRGGGSEAAARYHRPDGWREGYWRLGLDLRGAENLTLVDWKSIVTEEEEGESVICSKMAM